MIDFTLKNKIDDVFRYADMISNSQPDIVTKTGMTMREMLKYNLLQFVSFLFESDGTDGRAELEFIRDYIGMPMTIVQFMNFKYDKCMDKDFINTPPRCMLYFTRYDLSEGSRKSAAGRPISKEVVEIYKEIGTAFIALNGESVTELANLSNYTLMLDDFLKEYGLYFTDSGKGRGSSGKSVNKRKPKITGKDDKSGSSAKSGAAATPSAAGGAASSGNTSTDAEEDGEHHDGADARLRESPLHGTS